MNLQQAYKMAKGGKWIQSAIKRPGAFTKKAQAAGMGVQEFANKVSANPEEYPTRTRRQANLAKTLKNIRKGENGMDLKNPTGGKAFKNPMGPDSYYETEEAPEIAAGTQNPQEEEMEHIQPLDPNLKYAKAEISKLEREAEKDNVREYQRMLNRKYGAGLAEDGAWGPKTQAAYEKYVLAKKSTPAAKPAAKAAPAMSPEDEAFHGSEKKPIRMEGVDIKVKAKPTPTTLLPSRPIPQNQPKLSDYMSGSSAPVNTRSYSDNTRVNTNFKPTTPVSNFKQPTLQPKYTNPNQPTLSATPTGYRSLQYQQLLDRMKSGSKMKNGGMKKNC